MEQRIAQQQQQPLRPLAAAGATPPHTPPLQPDAAGQQPQLQPPRACPLPQPVDWGALPKDPGQKRAAVFTPYNIVFGGGERYLLTAAAVMQVGVGSWGTGCRQLSLPAGTTTCLP